MEPARATMRFSKLRTCGPAALALIGAGWVLLAGAASIVTAGGAAAQEVRCSTPMARDCNPQTLLQAAAIVQATNTAARTLATQSSLVVLDRIQQLRQQAQVPGQAAPATPLAYGPMVKKAPDPITPQLAQPAATTYRPAVWLRAFGDFENRDGVSGPSVLLPTGMSVIDPSYRQRTVGLLAGTDVVISRLTSASDGLILGLMGGASDSRVDFRSLGRVDLTGPSIGAYASYLNGGFFADLLFKTDFLSLRSDALGLPARADAQNYALTFNLGYKINLTSSWYVEPTAGIEHVWTEYSNQVMQVGSGVLAPYQNASSTRVRGGARIGTEWIVGGVRFEPSLTALAYTFIDVSSVNVNLSSVNLQFGAGGTGVTTLPSDQGKLFGEFQASLNMFDLSSGISGFIRGDVRFGENLVGGGGKVGLRKQW